MCFAHFTLLATIFKVFRELRNQRLLIGGHVRFLRDSFFSFLYRPDDKQSTLAEFCTSFNSIDQVLYERQDDLLCLSYVFHISQRIVYLWGQ